MKAKNQVKASVIVSNFTNQNTLTLCINILCTQQFPKKEYEVILPFLGNCSKEELVVLKQFEKEYSHFSILKISGKNRSELINQAAEQAQGEILLFIESHCIPDKHWIADMVKPFKNKHIEVMMGGIIPMPSRSWVSQSEEKLHKIIKKKLHPAYLDLHNTGMTKECFTTIRGLSNELPSTAELELGARLHQQNINIVKRQIGVVYHFNDTRILQYSRIIIKCGKDRTRMLIKHGKEFMKDYFPNPRFIKYLPLLKRFRIPILMGVIALKYTSMLGFKCGKVMKVFPISYFFFCLMANNSLRQGQLVALRAYKRIF